MARASCFSWVSSIVSLSGRIVWRLPPWPSARLVRRRIPRLDAGEEYHLDPKAAKYFRTIRNEFELRYPYACIKSGGDFGRPATERRQRYGASPSKEGIRPVGAKTTLAPPKLSKASFQTGGNDVFA